MNDFINNDVDALLARIDFVQRTEADLIMCITKLDLKIILCIVVCVV